MIRKLALFILLALLVVIWFGGGVLKVHTAGSENSFNVGAGTTLVDLFTEMKSNPPPIGANGVMQYYNRGKLCHLVWFRPIAQLVLYQKRCN